MRVRDKSAESSIFWGWLCLLIVHEGLEKYAVAGECRVEGVAFE